MNSLSLANPEISPVNDPRLSYATQTLRRREKLNEMSTMSTSTF